jgi:uncharacterized protein (UPF0303 family)
MEASAALEEDIRHLAEQERVLQLRQFGPEEAWMLGNIVREVAMAQGAPIAIDISLRDRVLFHCALPGSSTDNAEWIRRKRAQRQDHNGCQLGALILVPPRS